MSHEAESSEAGGRGELESRLERLSSDAWGIGAGGEQRRENLIERAASRGLDRAKAEQAYDMASEVGLEPAIGMAVVVEGISVRMLPSSRPDVGAAEPVEPGWVDTPPTAEQASRERRLRQTFRRLRALVEREPSREAALDAFRREPDLEAHDF